MSDDGNDWLPGDNGIEESSESSGSYEDESEQITDDSDHKSELLKRLLIGDSTVSQRIHSFKTIN